MTIRDIAIAIGFNVDEKSENNVESRIKGLKNMATKVLGAIGIGFSLVKINALAEEFNGINDTIKNATRELGNQEEIQQKILKAANDTKSAYGNTANMVSKLVQGNQSLFGNVDDAIAFTDITAKLFKTAGKADSEIQNLQDAMNKSFAKGAVETQTINQLIEKAPEAVKYLNKQLGTSSEKLLEMAANGKIKVSDLKDAFINSADEINANFAEMDYSISDALLNIRNQWGLFCDSLWTGAGVGEGVGKMMVRAFTSFLNVLKKLQPMIERTIKYLLNGVQKAFDLLSKVGAFLGRLVEKVGGVENAIKLLAIVAGAIFVALNAQKILGFLKSLGSMLSGINLKIMLIVAVIVLIALIIDDFINFMKGNDSVIGALFEKAGIDADAARETILNAWNKIKDFLIAAWNFIKDAAKAVFSALQEFWKKHGAQITEILKGAWEVIVQILKILFELISTIAQAVFSRLQEFWDRWGSTIIATFQVIWATLMALIQPFLDFLQGFITFLDGVFSGDWEKAWEGIKQMAAAVWEMIITVIKGAIELLQILFSGIFDPVLENIKSGWEKIVEWFKSLPDQAKQWGRDFLDGLVGGIKEKVSTVVDAVKGVGEKIKSFLHFSVPDEGPLTDYETWMPDFMGGLAKGIEDNEETVLGKIRKLAGGIATLTQAATAKAQTAMSGAVNNTSKSVTQNVNISNSYSGSDRVAQENVSKAMNKSASDATDYMAKGLAYLG